MLEKFLQNKPLYYDEIDYTRMPRIYKRVQANFKIPKIIHIVGTNAKGTTGRFIASAIASQNISCGHYTSPHILAFNERIWLNGKLVMSEVLENAHIALQNILSKDESNSLSYFEYTTFLAMYITQDVEYLVLEAGLGGEHDATSVFKSILSVITPISYDHEDFLGKSIEAIALTKLQSVQTQAVVAKQVHTEVYDVIKKLEEKTDKKFYDLSVFIDENDEEILIKVAKKLSLAPYMYENLRHSLSVLKCLGIAFDENSFDNAQLFARFTQWRENIIIDVGHNVLAAQKIADALDEKIVLIYNTYKDKNYKEILKTLRHKILRVEIIRLTNKRVVVQEDLECFLDSLNIQHKEYRAVNEEENYLVFGSFSVVEEFLKAYNE